MNATVAPSPRPDACPPQLPLGERPLLNGDQAGELARLFEVLASDTRLRLLHALAILGEPCAGDLAACVGMKPQAVSNQLRRLVDLGMLDTQRRGSFIHYRVVDTCITKLIFHGLCLNAERQKHLAGSRA